VLGEKHYTVWVVDGWMIMQKWWNNSDRGKRNYWEKNASGCHLCRHKSTYCCTDHFSFINNFRRCFLFKPATRPAAMRCGLWLAHLLMLRTITSAVRMRDVLLAFVQDLVHLQHWRVLALVYCAGRSVHRQRPALL